MEEKRLQVWKLFMQLTGLDPMNLQSELNPIIEKLHINLDGIQLDDIRKIVAEYMKITLEKERLKSVAFEDSTRPGPNYTN
jgi:hypothetical protein